MADQFAVVPFTTPSGTGTFDITSVKITETVKAAIFIFSHTTTDDSNVDHARCGVGLWADDGDSQGEDACISMLVENARTTTPLANTSKWTDALVGGVKPSPVSSDIEAAFDSVVSGGIRLNATVVSGGQLDGVAILFAGISRADTRRAVSQTTSAHEDCGVVSKFQPDFLVVIGQDGGYGSPVIGTGGGSVNLGFVTDSATIGALSYWRNATEPSESTGYVASASVPSSRTNVSPNFNTNTYSIDSTGFNHQSSVSGGIDTTVLAIKFSDPDTQIFVDNLTAPSGTGSQAYPTGFQPQVVLGQSTLIASEDTTTTDATAGGCGLFAFDDTNEYAVTVWSEDGETIALGNPSVAGSRQGAHGLLTCDENGTVAQEAASSLSGTGFSLNFSTATSGLFTALAIGAALPALVADDTETISDGVAFFVHQALVVDEGMTIIDACVALQTNALLGRIQSGDVLQARTDRAVTLSSGAAAGEVL